VLPEAKEWCFILTPFLRALLKFLYLKFFNKFAVCSAKEIIQTTTTHLHSAPLSAQENIHHITLSPRRSSIVNWAIKLFALVFFSYLLYIQVIAKDGIHEMRNIFLRQLTWTYLPWLIAASVLTPFNWAFEVFKWRTLLHRFEQISFFKAYQAVLAGVAFSIFTPNRIGEYGGRIMFIRPGNQLRAVIANLVGSFSQLLVILSLGFAGLLFFLYEYWNLDTWMLRAIITLGLVTTVLLLYCYFNVNTIVPFVSRLPFANRFKRFIKHVRVLKSYGTKELGQTLLFSIARYITYSLQYYFLLRFFGIEIPLLIGLASIATVFLLQTSIPLPPVTGLFARGEMALYAWGLFGASQFSSLSATFTLWIINLIIPALFGMVILLRINIVKSLGYEKKTRHRHHKDHHE
jgi:hypothetical protein